MNRKCQCLSSLSPGQRVEMKLSCVLGSDGMNGRQDQYQENSCQPHTQFWINKNSEHHFRSHIPLHQASNCGPEYLTVHGRLIKSRKVPIRPDWNHPQNFTLHSLKNELCSSGAVPLKGTSSANAALGTDPRGQRGWDPSPSLQAFQHHGQRRSLFLPSNWINSLKESLLPLHEEKSSSSFSLNPGTLSHGACVGFLSLKFPYCTNTREPSGWIDSERGFGRKQGLKISKI